MRRALGLALLLLAALAGCGGEDRGLQSPDDSSVVLQAIAAAAGSPVPEACTDTWTGPADGRWDEGANWSTGRAPGARDQACVPRGTRVRIGGGEHRAGSLVVGGGLRMTGGSLELTDASVYSLVGDLRLAAGSSLSGGGSLVVTGDDRIADGALAVGSATTSVDDPALRIPCGVHTPAGVEQCPAR